MKHGAAFLSLAAALTLAGPVSAQVESASGAQVLYDPVTNTTRVTDPLFQPNAAPQAVLDAEPIRLHMPRRHVVHRAPAVAAAASVAPAADTAMAAPTETPVETTPPAPPPKKIAKAAPVAPVSAPQEMAPPAGPDAAIPFSMDGSTTEIAPPPKAAGKQGKPQRVASAEPAPPAAQDGKHIRIIFTAGATEPTPETAASLASVAANLNTSLRTGSDRVLLQSYGGSAGDKSSDSRRLCLKRALSVRQLLIDSGIPSDRIDVRAMGGASVGDPPDRVDLIVHG